MTSMFVFTKDTLPPKNSDMWRYFRKKPTTRMWRIIGPFIVETREGTLRCEDGWIAVDSAGYPYPIAAEEQKAIYEEVTDVV